MLYSVVDAQIRVLAVPHDRRRPYYWTGRSSSGANSASRRTPRGGL